MSDEQLEAELVRLSRSRASGTKLQARAAALRAVLMSRARAAEAAEKQERLRRRQEMLERRAESADADDMRELAAARIFFELDFPELADAMLKTLGWIVDVGEWRHGSERVDQLVREGLEIVRASDPEAAFEAWRQGIEPLRSIGDR
jgi:hypothetical protein